MFELVHLKAVNGSFSISTVNESFAFFDIPPSVAEAVRTSIAAAPAGQ
jgi:hypothetical protein